MGIKSKPGDGIFGKGVRGNRPNSDSSLKIRGVRLAHPANLFFSLCER